MQLKLKIILLVILNLPDFARGQSSESIGLSNGYSIIPEVNFVSSASVQLYANSLNIFERNITDELEGGYGYGISVRKKLFRHDISFGISVEFLSIKDNSLTQSFFNDSVSYKARVTEELSVIPLEFTGFFNLPKFSEELNFYLGGGLGIYYGDRKRTVLNVESETVSKEAGYSLVIMSGMEYSISKNISGVFEVKFRQAEYSVRSVYPVSSIVINGNVFELEQNLNSKVFVDGLKLSLGLSYNF